MVYGLVGGNQVQDCGGLEHLRLFFAVAEVGKCDVPLVSQLVTQVVVTCVLSLC
jgi:hypothetical protein